MWNYLNCGINGFINGIRMALFYLTISYLGLIVVTNEFLKPVPNTDFVWPHTSNEFANKSIEPSMAEKNFHQSSDLYKKAFHINGQNVLVVIIDGKNDRHAIHDPEFCFKGSGWSISNSRKLPINGGQGNLIRLDKNGITSNCLFWFSDGHNKYSSFSQFVAATTLNKLKIWDTKSNLRAVCIQSFPGQPVDFSRLSKDFDPVLAKL